MTKITIDRAIVEQALEALEQHRSYEFQHAARAALRAELAKQAQDWDEIEALRESLREHMAEIHRLRAALADHSGDATEMDQEIEAAMADQVTHGLGITLGGKRIDPASIYKQAEPATRQKSRHAEPVAWLESPHGSIRANPNYKFTFPSQLLHWQIPLYTATPKADPVQEPVAWMWEETAPRSSTGIGGIDRKLLFCRPADEPWKRNITPLYTAPPQRKPLTHEEIKSMWGITEYREFAIDFARAIELAHGIGDA